MIRVESRGFRSVRRPVGQEANLGGTTLVNLKCCGLVSQGGMEPGSLMTPESNMYTRMQGRGAAGTQGGCSCQPLSTFVPVGQLSVGEATRVSSEELGKPHELFDASGISETAVLG